MGVFLDNQMKLSSLRSGTICYTSSLTARLFIKYTPLFYILILLCCYICTSLARLCPTMFFASLQGLLGNPRGEHSCSQADATKSWSLAFMATHFCPPNLSSDQLTSTLHSSYFKPVTLNQTSYPSTSPLRANR